MSFFSCIGYFSIVIIFIVLVACNPNEDNSKVILSNLRIGILPDESKDKLLEHYTPLFKYLAAETQIPYELIIPKSYGQLLELSHTKTGVKISPIGLQAGQGHQ